MEIPEEALYGIHSLRAHRNFPDRTPFHAEWYRAMGLVKKACYLAAEAYERAARGKFGSDTVPGLEGVNLALVVPALLEAAAQVAEGAYYEDFIVPAVSGGAGTSINMNVNEIIANAALVGMGLPAGRYDRIDPIAHANLFQSTNDVVPTALRVALLFLLQDLEKAINLSRAETERLETAHQRELRAGYTQMQEAVPSSFGKLFSTYSEALSRDWWRVSKCFERIKTVNLGGSAIGTGIAVPRFFIMEATAHLQAITGLPVTRSENLADATSNLDAFVEIHATLKAHAVNLEKMVSDLRLLASDLVNQKYPGHQKEHLVVLPQVQVGSSIMPGKINPVIPEFVISSVHRVYANDQLIASLCGQGCLELNAYLPVIGHALLESVKLLIACNNTLKDNLLSGLGINSARGLEALLYSPSLTTALVPYTGYHKASELAKLMKSDSLDIYSACERMALMERSHLEKILSPENLLKLGYTITEIG